MQLLIPQIFGKKKSKVYEVLSEKFKLSKQLSSIK